MKRILLVAALVLLCAAPSWGFGFGFGFGTWFGGKARAGWVDLVQSLSWSTTTYDFGSHDVGTTDAATFTITNSGNDTAEDVATTVTGAAFSLYSTTTFGNISSLPGTNTRPAKVKFTPSGAGVFTGFLRYSAPNIPRVDVALSGTGVGGTPAATASPTTLAFGGVSLGTTSELNATLINTGTANLIIGTATITGTDSAKFSITGNACSGITSSYGASCIETVSFTPGATAGGPYTAALNLPHNATGSPTVVTLSGSGVNLGTYAYAGSGSSSAYTTAFVRTGAPTVDAARIYGLTAGSVINEIGVYLAEVGTATECKLAMYGTDSWARIDSGGTFAPVAGWNSVAASYTVGDTNVRPTLNCNGSYTIGRLDAGTDGASSSVSYNYASFPPASLTMDIYNQLPNGFRIRVQ